MSEAKRSAESATDRRVEDCLHIRSSLSWCGEGAGPLEVPCDEAVEAEEDMSRTAAEGRGEAKGKVE